MTLPPASVALLRALRDAGGALPYFGAGVTVDALHPLRCERLARFAGYRGDREYIELTPAGHIEAARLAEEESK